ncbi:tRNA (guanosine(46)-N7)-methyltransferase TrmB [Rivularia sp. UHCC 0363]|uniref:tRNA (guanosine(46)-N7)-methyltransferase TrmB n=1 Tax=Rivularia sp. UHCC 0363 TaxID=3110244 RepID=UPI002B1FA614|nr:tRNA (guanosine(46)-N7)-methyltransferase TrmB [Rivularia sp. UHCC 0363]MEA5596582.1 tRNA (guanosine(46)-N7)-methyltransferase TrmB [Rivularia sp. UHCC 0363]
MNRVRVRQHVNPLGIRYQTPINPIDWERIYLDMNQPLLLDIGCARGQFLIEMAQLEPNCNFLGLEIREPLVETANKTRSELGLTNLHYIFCNANNSLKPLLSSLPKGILQQVTIQFPDPWFKNRHGKRRVVQPQLVAELAEYLAPGGTVFLQSDVKFVAIEMCDRFDENPAFHRQSKQWLAENPLRVATERELFTLENSEPVYRTVFTKI